MSDTPETDKSVRTFQAWDVPSARHVIVEYVFIHTAKRLERERDGWREAAYSLAEAIPASWDELQPPVEQLRKFKEMVACQNKKTKEFLDNADKHSKMYP